MRCRARLRRRLRAMPLTETYPMNQPESPLAKVQRWMQAVIMHPDGVEAGLDSAAGPRAYRRPAGAGRAGDLADRRRSRASSGCRSMPTRITPGCWNAWAKNFRCSKQTLGRGNVRRVCVRLFAKLSVAQLHAESPRGKFRGVFGRNAAGRLRKAARLLPMLPAMKVPTCSPKTGPTS